MIKGILRLTTFIFALVCYMQSIAQSNVVSNKILPSYKIAIFAPLYLDSAFSEDNYKYGKKFPKFLTPGFDFVQGCLLALDSMPSLNANITAQVFDSKAAVANIPSLISSGKLDSFNLILGSVRDEEVQDLGAFSKQKNIPFVSVTYPNDAGVTGNPFMVIVNSTLKSHCEAIYSFLLQGHSTDKILLARKPGVQEDRIQEYFTKINAPDGKPLLKIETVNIKDDYNIIKAKLDSNRNNIVIGASLSEDLAVKLANTAAPLDKKYHITLIGMPNWDGFSFANKKNAIKDFPIYYTSPYYNNKWDSNSKMIQNFYTRKFKSSPSDMTYKGFESMHLFTKVLASYSANFSSHLNDYGSKVFTEYNFKPVYTSTNMAMPDYFENKHLYFIKMLNGTYSKAW